MIKLKYSKIEIFRDNYLKVIKYNDNNYKVIQFKRRVRKPGYEEEKLNKTELPLEKVENDTTSVEYLLQSFSRTRKNVRAYALCNDFEYFVTFTFDRKKINATDIILLKKQVGQWLNNYKKRRNKNLKYLLIPELHRDLKHFHFHGLISGIEDIKEFRLSKKGAMRYNWTSWDEKFGFTSLEKVRDINAVGNYITKYITKDLMFEFNKQRYLVSKGLKKPQTIFEIENYTAPIQCDFENEYVREKFYDSYDNVYKFLNSIYNNIDKNEGSLAHVSI